MASNVFRGYPDMKILIEILLLTLVLVGPSIVPDERQPLCPAVSTLVLRDAPATCLHAGVQAKMEQLQRTLQRLRQQMERRMPQS
jgi:hypothetical protein